MEIKGTITNILSAESGNSRDGKAWTKQTFAINTTGQYPKLVAFDLFGKNYEAIKDKLHIGSKVSVKFDASSREWNGKYYTQLTAYQVDIEAPDADEAMESSGHYNLNAGADHLPF